MVVKILLFLLKNSEPGKIDTLTNVFSEEMEKVNRKIEIINVPSLQEFEEKIKDSSISFVITDEAQALEKIDQIQPNILYIGNDENVSPYKDKLKFLHSFQNIGQASSWVMIHRYSVKLNEIGNEKGIPAEEKVARPPQEPTQDTSKEEGRTKEVSTTLPPIETKQPIIAEDKKVEQKEVTNHNQIDEKNHANPTPSYTEADSSKDGGEGRDTDKGEETAEENKHENKKVPKDTETPTEKEKEKPAPNNKKEKEKEKPIEVNSNTQPFQYDDEERFITERALEIRKNSFFKASWDRNKTIGVWAPLNRTGVTTFVMNYSIFLGMERVPIAVLESLNPNHIIKTTLKRYSEIPNGWNSYATALHKSEISSDSVVWSYNGVHWLPLDDNDTSHKWNYDTLYHYINNVKYFDVVLVDLPTGKMESYTEHTLELLDELWIIVDDAFQQTSAWKKYIHCLIGKYKLKSYLVFNKKLPFSQDQRLASELDIPLLSSLPCMHYEVQKNYYEKTPIIEQHTVYQQLKEPFITISKHLLGDSFDVKEKGLIHKIRSILPMPLRGKKKRGMI